jgi:hypothetical protein
MWTYVTGEKLPQRQVTAEEYNHYNLPWFDYYDEDCKSVHGSKILDSVKSINGANHDFEDDVNVKDPEIIISTHQKSVRILIFNLIVDSRRMICPQQGEE